MRFTEDQQSVIESNGQRTLVAAFAGTGKTSTLVGFAKARPSSRMLYLAFNKSIQTEAQRKFPKNVQVMTGHGMAYQVIGKQYKHKFANNLYAAAFIELIPKEIRCPDDYAYLFSYYTTKTLQNFMQSADYSLKYKHLPMTDLNESPLPSHITSEHIAQFAAQIWARMCNPNDDSVPMVHDGYLKLFHLSRPSLNYDYILFDECQDANPLMLDLVNQQNAKVVYVGDTHQSIYSFRGAVNAMELIDCDTRLCLKTSFRFGKNVAHVANALLSHFKGEETAIIGAGANDYLYEVHDDEPCLQIYRSSTILFMAAIKALKKNQPMHFIGGIEGYNLDLFVEAYRFKCGHSSSDPLLAGFQSWNHLVSTAEITQERNLLSTINIVDRYNTALPKLVKALYARHRFKPEDAHVWLSTAHRSKGLEHDNVILGDDFPDLLDDSFELPPEEVNLQYVAVTRAQRKLQLNKTIQSIVSSLGYDQSRVCA